jgi:hypothetical protein
MVERPSTTQTSVTNIMSEASEKLLAGSTAACSTFGAGVFPLADVPGADSAAPHNQQRCAPVF